MSERPRSSELDREKKLPQLDGDAVEEISGSDLEDVVGGLCVCTDITRSKATAE